MRRITFGGGRANCQPALRLALLAACLIAPTVARADAPAAPPVCDAPIYAGIRHCVHVVGPSLVHVLIVDLADPAVSFHLSLPALNTPTGPQECDSTRHCGDGPYPFETVPHMLARHAAGGAVAGINTDYFGLSRHPDHGAEGVAVRDGVRLDDVLDPGLVGHTSLAISRAGQASLIWVGPRVTLLDLAGRHFTVAGGGPLMISAGQPLDNQACPAEGLHVAVCTRSYHSAAGLAANRTLVLATARYMDTAALAQFLVEAYGVIAAVKFDGGGSAQMAWLDADPGNCGQGECGAVTGFDASNTTDGGFRRVAEALLVYSRPLTPMAAADLQGYDILHQSV